MTTTRTTWPTRHRETQRTAATTRRKKDTANVLRGRAERGAAPGDVEAARRRHPSAKPAVPAGDSATAQETARQQAQIERLDAVIEVIDTERRAARSDKVRRSELTQPWPVFVRRMRLLTAQSWGSRVQNYLAAFYGWTKVDQRDDRGDVTTTDGAHAEVKVTMVTASNPKVNFVQLRPYQDIDGYRLFVIDRDYSIRRFDLTKAQMSTEIAAIGEVAHGSLSRRNGKDDCEYAIRFDWNADNAIRKRWEKTYLVASDDDVTPDLMTAHRYENAAALRERLGLGDAS